jgi:hypothetical protein
MSTIRRTIGLAAAAAGASLSLWACRATANGDSITIEFSPDMTITAWGLEDALGKLIDLLDSCNSGTFGRPCTPDETAAIERSILRVLDRKGRMGDPPSPTWT